MKKRIFIGIDANEANVRKRVGSNEFAYQIIKWLFYLRNSQKRYSNLYFRIFFKDKPLENLPPQFYWWNYQILRPRFLWTQWRLPLQLFKERKKINVFFSPGHYGPRFCFMPLIISIMDLAFLHFPRFFKKRDLWKLKRWTENSVKQATRIITISEFTKNEVVNFYHIHPDKIKVIYPAVEEIKLNDKKTEAIFQNLKKKYQIKKNYFLYVGTLQPRKNLERLIASFNKLLKLENKKNFQLIICGKKGWFYEKIFAMVKKLKLNRKVVFTDFIPEIEKVVLLKKAFALVLPSFYEGFGIPALEALIYGCLPIVSKNSSLTEVVGKGGIYIENPYSVDSIFQSLVKVIKLDNQERKKISFLAKKQAQKFSWRKSGEKTLDLIKELGEKNVV